jgi:integrase
MTTTATRRTFGSTRSLPSGKIQARYVGPDGVRYTAPVTFLKPAHANKWLSGVETAISAGTWVSPKTPVKTSETFGVYALDWVEKRKLAPGTRSIYRRQLERFLLPAFGEKRLDAIDIDMVIDWHAGMDAANPTQNAQVYTLLHTIMGTATRTRKVPFNPVDIEGAGSVKRAKTITVLSPAEVRALADAMPVRLRVLVLLTGFGCLRFGEGVELRRNDVVGGKLRIRRAVSWVDGESIVKSPKTVAGSRDVPIVPAIRPMLAAHILAHAEPGEDGLLFPALRGGHLTHSTVSTALKRAAKTIGRPELSWHMLRHTGAVMWAQDPSINLADLMSLLGHETASTALLYQHAVDGKLDDAAVRLDAHFAQDSSFG